MRSFRTTKARIIHICLLALALCDTTNAFDLGDEVLRYNVTYKWGLINKNAGTAVMTVSHQGDGYRAELCARSDPWADRIYQVRDTLVSVMNDRLQPLLYEKLAHEDGKFSHDLIRYKYQGNTVEGYCTRFREKNGTTSTEHTELTATLPTADMLSVYFFIRSMDFHAMKPGDVVSVNMFSGKRKELLYLTYTGTEEIRIGKHTYNCYGISFRFTSNGKTKSSENMTGWITTDASRIPVRITGTLPVGKIHVLYAGGE